MSDALVIAAGVVLIGGVLAGGVVGMAWVTDWNWRVTLAAWGSSLAITAVLLAGAMLIAKGASS